MIYRPGVVGHSAALETAYHLFDHNHRSTPQEMDSFLFNVRYPFVRDSEDSAQMLVDCVLADGVDATVLERLHSSNGIHYVDYTGDVQLLHNRLPESTRRHQNTVHERSRIMTRLILEHVDMDADWSIKTMQAMWRICVIATIEEDGTQKTRKNDDLKYWVHPLRGTVFLREAMRRVIEKGTPIPLKDQIALMSGGLVHDASEDWVKHTGHYSLDPTVAVMSPLVIKRTAKATMRDPYLPGYIANASRLMTFEDKLPWSTENAYEENIDRVSSNFISAIVKPCVDCFDNHQIDELPIPIQKRGETDEKFAMRLQRFEYKTRVRARLIFGDGMLKLPNRKNAFHHDRRAIAYGRQILTEAQGIVEKDGDRERYPHVDWSKAIPLEKYKDEVYPEWEEKFAEDFELDIPERLAV